MANVNLNVLSNVNSDRNNSAVFTDLTLDVIINKTYSNQLYKTQQIIDIQSDNNLGAIYNSISNLITTSPLFGISFRDLLFLPVSEDRGRLIGTTISENIQKFEPRVNINNINIIPDEEQQQYIIELNISVPRFNVQQTKIVGVLDKAGFYYNNN